MYKYSSTFKNFLLLAGNDPKDERPTFAKASEVGFELRFELGDVGSKQLLSWPPRRGLQTASKVVSDLRIIIYSIELFSNVVMLFCLPCRLYK